jgi:hypothetical protein
VYCAPACEARLELERRDLYKLGRRDLSSPHIFIKVMAKASQYWQMLIQNGCIVTCHCFQRSRCKNTLRPSPQGGEGELRLLWSLNCCSLLLKPDFCHGNVTLTITISPRPTSQRPKTTTTMPIMPGQYPPPKQTQPTETIFENLSFEVLPPLSL